MYQNFARRSAEQSAAARPLATEPREDADRHAHQALETIYRREREGLLRFLKRRVGEDQACDVAQEVFLRAMTSLQIAHLANPGGFLNRIARNVLIDLARRRNCRIITLPFNEAIDAQCAPEQPHALEANDLKVSLELAMMGLPDRTRAVFAMHRFEEKPYREIHRELDISLAAVEYHMMKALAHIRECLEQVDPACSILAQSQTGPGLSARRCR